MQKIDMIIGKPAEGKTNKLIKSYVDFCKGETIIDGLSYKNIDLNKPVFISINGSLDNFIEKTRDLLYYEAHENLYINMETDSDKLLDLWVNTINDKKQDVILFMDINIPFYNVGNYISTMSNDIGYAMNNGIKVDVVLTVVT